MNDYIDNLRPACQSDVTRIAPRILAMEFRALSIQLARGPSLAIERRGKLLAIVGLVKIKPGVAEFWMRMAAGVAGTRDALAVLKVVRRQMWLMPTGIAIFANVRAGHRAGRVIARRLGARHVGNTHQGLLEQWVLLTPGTRHYAKSG